MLHHSTVSKKTKIKAVIVIFLLLDIVLFAVFYIRLQPIVESMAVNKAKNVATQTINDAAGTALEESNIEYDKLMSFEKNNNGDILAVKANTIEINLLKHNITSEVIKEINEMDSSKLSVPIGTVIGGHLFSGRGPKVQVKIDNVGNVKTKVVNQFTSTGINQTRQQITIEIEVSITVLVAAFPVSTNVTTNYPIADTVIVGNVPNSYTVIEDSALGDSDTAKKVQIYGNNS